MFNKTYYATSPKNLHNATNDDLRADYLITDLFAAGELQLYYLHYERFIIGGAAPNGAPISLPTQTEPESAKGNPFLERRELGVVNVGSTIGKVTVDGSTFELKAKDGLYVLTEYFCLCLHSVAKRVDAEFTEDQRQRAGHVL